MNRDRRRTTDDRAEELFPFVRSDLLGVVQRREAPNARAAQHVVVEQHTCNDQRAGERATAGFVGPRDEPDTQPAVATKKPLAGSVWHGSRISLRPVTV